VQFDDGTDLVWNPSIHIFNVDWTSIEGQNPNFPAVVGTSAIPAATKVLMRQQTDLIFFDESYESLVNWLVNHYAWSTSQAQDCLGAPQGDRLASTVAYLKSLVQTP
jgi:hypothetical protein